MAAASLALGAAGGLSGCKSPWVQATVINDEDSPVKLVEVNYPGGSFGVQSIAPHSSFHYRFHILSDSPVEVDFSDAAGHNEVIKGPELEQGEEGTLTIDIRAGDKVVWSTNLKKLQ
ncbi:MAG TPA: hypothetical protein VHX60_00400 [Acidobacteriaceae bacterium]|nr:hypothetical protein [Acidobacteriaceae bacterium]